MKASEYLTDLEELLKFSHSINLSNKAEKIKFDYLIAELSTSIVGLCEFKKRFEHLDNAD